MGAWYDATYGYDAAGRRTYFAAGFFTAYITVTITVTGAITPKLT